MPLLNTMTERLRQRISQADLPYSQFIYLADVHYEHGSSNRGFDKILSQITEQERKNTLFILVGGDLVDSGSEENYKAFVDRCNRFYEETKGSGTTGIPIIPCMGNHEFYGVQPKNTELATYKKWIGSVNFPLDIPVQGLGHSLRIVAFNDAKPHQLENFSIPNPKENCSARKKRKHLFYFPYNYIRLSDKAPEKYSHFPDYLTTDAHHIIVTMHVPPRKDPLPRMLDAFIEKEYAACLPVKSMGKLKEYYRNLWMLVHGNSTADKTDSTEWFISEIKKHQKVEMVLMGHVHTFYPYIIPEIGNVRMVISGGGGNRSASAYDPTHPVTKYHYLRIKYDANTSRFVYEKVDAGK